MIKEVWKFIKAAPFKVWDWVIETYEWLLEAFTNWDMQVDDFKDQIVFMAHKTGEILVIIVEKIGYIVKEFITFVSMLVEGFKGWR